FTGLLSNNTYTVKVTYSYNLNDGAGAQESVKTLDITTDAKAIPTIEIINPSKTQTSVAFEIQETDTDNVGEVTKIELVHANGTVVADNVSVREFTSLLSNNTYTVQATYTYNLNDGVGAQEIIKTLEITTGAKATPSIEIVNPTKTQTSVAFEINEVDTDNIGEITKIELYDAVQNTILSTLLDFENLYFGGLSPYTKYSVAITYQYNLNDGIGNQTAVQFYVFYTMPVVECTAMEILNTATVFEGDTIVLQLNVNNPSTVSFKQAKVNGEYYAVDVSSNTTVLVRIEYKEQFAGGETVLTVEELIGKIGEETLSWTITNNNQDSILIAGKLTVESIVLVNKNYEEIKYAFPSEEVGVLITLNNPTGYTISATSLGNNIVNIDSNHIFIPQTLTSGGTVKSLYYISYHNGEVNNELRLSRPISTQWVYCIASSDIVEVTSAEQLFNMDDGYYYKLMNDIDLSSYQWINAGNLNGVLDGNGYAIKNMRNTSTVIDQHLEISLFYTAEGYIINLDVENCFIDAITTSLTDRYYYAGFGGFAFNGTYVAENCSFNYDTSINGNSCIGDIIDGIHYQIGDGVATVISCSEGIQKAVILESITINGKSYPVTTIDSGAFRSCVYLTSVIIPNSVTRIGNSAFNGCSNLTNLVIGDNVTTIDPFAFANCSSLTSIVLPNSVTTIGSFAFQSCTILTSISIPDSVTTIDSYAFEDCVGLTSIVIPNSVTSIGAEAFSGCSNLNNIVLSNNLTAISDGMFRACRSLTNIIIPNSVTSIGADAFRGVPLTSIVIPSNVASIGRLAFGYCSTLESVVIARTGARMTINTAAFDGCQGLTSIIIPARVAYIKSEAFYNCQNLTIYCEASSKPSGWASDWNLLLYGQVDVCPVVWGYQPEIQP
ncbi:MAG: leucine-rich repeat domain-containing protein, partial [Clostridia bacterium]|nr:leucine-rich repeat domain-containing protein [Clostridia bacterium]